VFGGKKGSIEPVRLDVSLSRAPWVAGTVVDEHSREPIAGAWVHYYPAQGNTRAGEYLADGRSVDIFGRTGPDGRFRLPAVPGRGWLTIGHDRGYVPAADRQLQGDATDRTMPTQIPTTMGTMGVGGDALVTVDIDPKASRDYTITLDPGVTVPVTLTDPDGKPVAGALALGVRSPFSQWSKPLASHKLDVPAFSPDRPRALVLYHPDRNLGLLFQPKKGKAGPWAVKLQPTATVTGRLVLPDGKPYPNVTLTLSFACAMWPGWASPPAGLPEASTKTDADGRFTFTKIIGDVDYSFGYPVFQDKFTKTATVRFTAKPTELKHLGTLTSKAPEE
jgi:hypothetical protein